MALGKRPGDGHITGVDEKPQIEHDKGYERVPFLGAQAALTTILIGKTKKQVGRSNALVKSCAYLLSVRGDSIVVNKGGVGKTSLACATTIDLASKGKKILLVSTDPASNVGQVFETELGNKITKITTAPGVDAIEINPEEAAAEVRAFNCKL